MARAKTTLQQRMDAALVKRLRSRAVKDALARIANGARANWIDEISNELPAVRSTVRTTLEPFWLERNICHRHGIEVRVIDGPTVPRPDTSLIAERGVREAFGKITGRPLVGARPAPLLR